MLDGQTTTGCEQMQPNLPLSLPIYSVNDTASLNHINVLFGLCEFWPKR